MLKQFEGLYDELVSIRRHFHMYPEVSFTEEKTPAYIAKYLQNLGIEVTEKVGGRGVVGKIIGTQKGKTAALRADFDALPIQDAKDVPYKSKIKGVMHACGHDAHTATLLGMAKVLQQNRDKIKGEVRLIFQFAEELAPGGAAPMIADGCLDGVDAIFGNHMWASMPVGKYGYKSGYLMAASDKFSLTINGKGGHGAAPHETVDPIVIGANIVTNLQQIVSRKTNPLSPAVLTIGQFNAGTAFNVIPDTANLTGTVRTYENDVQENIIKSIEDIISANCKSFGATYKFNYEKGYPAVKNHENETKLLVNNLQKIVKDNDILEMQAVMGGEDFAYYLEKVPGTFFFTGAGNIKKGIVYPHHHPMFDIDEQSMVYAGKAMLTTVIDFLAI